MSLFQSALDFLAGPGSLGAASRDQNDFVGQTVEMGDMKLRIKRVIAEGKSRRRRRQAGGGAGLGWASLRALRLGSPLPSLAFLGREGFLLGRPRPARGGRPWGGRRAVVPGRGRGRWLPAARADVRWERLVCLPLAASVRGHGCTELTQEPQKVFREGPAQQRCAVLAAFARFRNARRASVFCGNFFTSLYDLECSHRLTQLSKALMI